MNSRLWESDVKRILGTISVGVLMTGCAATGADVYKSLAAARNAEETVKSGAGNGASPSHKKGTEGAAGNSSALWLSDTLDAFSNATKLCGDAGQKLYKRVGTEKSISTTIGAIGIMAGSIIVPGLAARTAISKSTVAAWGGVSGSANAGQLMLNDNGISPVKGTAVYKEFQKGYSVHINNVFAAPDEKSRQLAIAQMTAYCEMPPIENAEVIPPAAPAAPS
ncbi:MAG: hypothetical protein HGA47_00080 [Zoogloea sp.]|nr:hypothetical protein [Zoogloea sp.]